jgi:formate dehydrogenase iron-sulfur subunit
LTPACAQVCPTESIVFGDMADLRREASRRLDGLAARGVTDAVLYDAHEGSVGGTHALFIVRGDPVAYNLPPKPDVPSVYLRRAWRSAFVTAASLIGAALIAFAAQSHAH